MEPKRAGFDYVGLVVPADGVMESGQSTTAQAGERRVAAFPGAGRLAAFFTLLVILFFVADFLIDTGLRRIPTGPFGVYNRLMIGDIDAEVLVTGSSRALNGFDPRVIQSETGARAYNIGINGSQTDMQVAVLKTYLRHNPKPALIVHSLDSFSFVTSRSGVWFPGQYMPYLQEDGIYHGLRAVDRDAWKARYLPLYGYAVEDMNFTWLTGLKALLGRFPQEDRYLGFQPRDAPWNEEFAHFKDAAAAGVRFPIEPQGVRDLEELLATCRAQGIRVLLVYSPVYIEMQRLERNRDEIFGLFRELAGRYDAPLWDYSGSAVSGDRGYFVNSQHLNASGAAVFSREFAGKLAHSGLLTTASK
jgi:hypothetical protein